MKKHPVVFVAVKEYDHLGIGYMTAVLSSAGFETKIINFHRKKTDILRMLRKLDPLLVGFSVIYQYHIDQFSDLVSYLRKEGITCHFTAGGNYASLMYEELFDFIPYLDSIVRFEGENTILKLAVCIHTGSDWKKLKSIAYTDKGKIRANPLCPLESDLDKFPFPLRSALRVYAFDKKFATIIAGRGCIHNCTFCNINRFYSLPPGEVKRIRRPEMVVKEMEHLHNTKSCSIFLFLDDDFPVKAVNGYDWVKHFCKELNVRGLNNRIMWRICCRPDEVDEEKFSMMKRNGLFQVFLGIEDGTDIGLKRLNKHMTVEKSRKGIYILKKLRIGFDYGFLLFQPYSTFTSLNENLDFLRQLCGDGYTPVTFLKLMPYYETRIEKELLTKGRLKVLRGARDYDFSESSLNHYYDFITDIFMEWLRYTDGLENISRWAKNYFQVYLFYYGSDSYFLKLYSKFTKTISESNLFLLDTMKELSVFFESGKYLSDDRLLEDYRKRINSKHESFKGKIHRIMDMLLFLGQTYQ